MASIFSKLFKKRTSQTQPAAPQAEEKGNAFQDTTKPLPSQPATVPLADEPENPLGLQPPQLLAACAQSVGLQREHNEDALFALTTLLASNGTTYPFGIYIVADGMGGHQYGEVASEVAVRTMSEHLIEHIYRPIFQINQQSPDAPLRDILEAGVNLAHNAILGFAPGGGTTLTLVLILDNQMAIAHVGDSRVYEVKLNGAMRALTRDHSLVKRLEELGQLTPEEAAVHPQRNVLYRALGQGEPFEPEIITAPVPESGYLLICSDGLWGVIPEKTIGNIIKTAPTLHEACQQLVDAANEAGGPDNISAILVRLPE